MRPMALLATLIALSGAVAWAEGGARSSRWEVNSQLIDKPEGCFYLVEGHAPGLPEGTSLHVNLVTAGVGPNILRAAFFKVVVQANGDFTGSFHWPNKKFAPLVYTTKVELFVNTQAPGVRRTLMREFGYPANAREMVAEEEIAHGKDDAERVAFSLAGLTQVEQLVEEGGQLCQASGQAWADRSDETWFDRWEASEREKLMAFQVKLSDFENEFVIRREADLVTELGNVIMDLLQAPAAVAGNPDYPLHTVVERLEGRLRQIRVEIESRRPLGSVDPDDKQPAERGDAPKGQKNETDE